MSSDPTEAIRRELVPIVNESATAAVAAATAKIVEEFGAGTEVSDEEGATLLARRDEDARKLLYDRLTAENGEGNVFDTTQVSEHFEVIGFMAPFVVVRRKADNKKGTLMFTHHPRFYFGFQADSQ